MAELHEIVNELRNALDRGGLTLDQVLVAGRTTADVRAPDRHRIKRLMTATQVLLSDVSTPREPEPPQDVAPELVGDAEMQLARGLLAEQRWAEAAAVLDSYAALVPDDWKGQYARGVAHANARTDSSALAALRAYNEALAFAPDDMEPWWWARLLSYRAGMLKRLGRTDFAEADLQLALRWADGTDEVQDVQYNLASIYAMTARREKAMELVRALKGSPYLGAIAAHVDDYFAHLSNDPEFRRIVFDERR